MAVLLPLAAALLGAAPPAGAASGDLIVWFRNQDLEGERNGFEASWLAPWNEQLKLEAGASYWSLDDVDWGYLIAGGWYSFQEAPYTLSARLKQGRGSDPRDDFNYTNFRTGLTRGFLGHRISVEGEFELIRVDRAEFNLARIGTGLVPHPSTSLHLGYFHHLGGDETNGVTTRADYHTRWGTAFGGYTWSSADTDVLRAGSIASTDQHTHEYFFGLRRPVGRHSISLIGSRAHTRGNTRSAIDLIWRWSLPPDLWGRAFGR